MAHDVFISYSSKDKAVADAVVNALESRRVRCWVAPRDVLPGCNWMEAIVDAIDGSRVMVLVYSGYSNVSPQVQREVERAVHANLPILPFRIEMIGLSKPMQYLVSSSHWLDAVEGPTESNITRLAETTQVLLRTLGQDLPANALDRPGSANGPDGTGALGARTDVHPGVATDSSELTWVGTKAIPSSRRRRLVAAVTGLIVAVALTVWLTRTLQDQNKAPGPTQTYPSGTRPAKTQPGLASVTSVKLHDGEWNRRYSRPNSPSTDTQVWTVYNRGTRVKAFSWDLPANIEKDGSLSLDRRTPPGPSVFFALLSKTNGEQIEIREWKSRADFESGAAPRASGVFAPK